MSTELELRAISIRLPIGVIDAFKTFAEQRGVRYQPLMKEVLCIFAEAEMRRLLTAAQVEARKEPKS